MKKSLIFLIAILLFGIKEVSGQNYLNYYETINKAEIANLDMDFEKSDYLLAAINCEKLNNNQHAFEYLKKGIFVGLTIKSIKKQLSNFKKSKEWKLLKENYDSIRQEYMKSLNLTLRKELIEMVEKDQASRHPIFGSWKKSKKIDRYNYNRLLEIIKENNGKWPGRYSIGDGKEGTKYAIGEVTIMLHHFSTDEVNNLKAILVEAILIGDLSPYNVAHSLDYKNLETIGERKRGKKIFLDICLPIGSYGSTSGNQVVICDCEKAEEERKELGLEPLDDYYRKRDLTYECFEEK